MAQARVLRRLAAILVADIVGYTSKIENDELETRVRFNDLLDSVILPAIEDYGGRLVKTMGDGVLVEFSSVVNSVQAGVEIQSATAKQNSVQFVDHPWQLRIGIHLGDVIVEDDDIHGEGVNIASRLEGLANPGEICVSDMVYTGVRNKLDLIFKDLGQKSLKNVADPLQVYSIVLKSDLDNETEMPIKPTERPAVAVLPFKNLSENKDQDYFADGLTEEIIISLLQFRFFPVIGGSSTFAYKGRSIDIRTVGEQLGARYIVEGTVREAGGRIRITSQLSNAKTGHHVWAERFEGQTKDIFSLQDEVSKQIAAVIEPTLVHMEERATFTKAPSNLTAWEYCVRGNSHIAEFTKEALYEARNMYNRAIELDPILARAYSGLATTYSRELRFFEPEDRVDCNKRFKVAALKAVQLDESDPTGPLVLSIAHAIEGNLNAAIKEARRAVELNPLDSRANSVLGLVLSLSSDQFEEGIPYFEKALQLTPLDPNKRIHLIQLALTQICVGRYENALANAQEAVIHGHDLLEAQLTLASALGFLNRGEEALSVMAENRATVKHYLENHPLFSNKVKEIIVRGLQNAHIW